MQLSSDERRLVLKILEYYASYQCSIHSREYEEIQTVIDKITKDVLPLWLMLEAAIALAVSTITAVAALTNRVYGRVHEMDRRIDKIELRIAEQYVSKSDLSEILDRMETHMIRIENKLDKIAITRR